MDKKVQAAVQAMDLHKSQRKAAAALGITRDQLRDLLGRAQAVDAQASAAVHESRRAKELSSIIEQQQELLERARKPRVPMRGAKPPRPQKGEFIRVIIPDSHGKHIEQAAAAAMLADMDELKPSEVVMLGDHIDCSGFLAQHHTLGHVAESEYSFEEDIGATNDFLDAIQARCSGQIHYLEGNHERRIESWIVTQTLRHKQDAKYLRKLFGVEKCLNFEARGIKHYRQSERYGGLSIPCTIKLGHCYFTHGTRTGPGAALKTLQDFSGNVVFGHTHTPSVASKRSVSDDNIYAWNPGCLTQLQPLWQHTQITNWGHGYAIQFVNGSGEFLHINVPILGGTSYLGPHLARLRQPRVSA